MEPTESGEDFSRADLDAEIKAEQDEKRRVSPRKTGWILLVGGIIAWYFALGLAIEKLELLRNPNEALGCDINPFVACSGVMNTWQASVFGFPNMYIGLAGFAMAAMAGLLLIARVSMPRWMHVGLLVGMTFAIAFITFLQISSLYVIGKLCPYCMAVWACVGPMFFYTLAYSLQESHIKLRSGVARFVSQNRLWITVAWFAVVIALILIEFWDVWLSMAGL